VLCLSPLWCFGGVSLFVLPCYQASLYSRCAACATGALQVHVTAIPNEFCLMSHGRSWPLSQEANKSNGVCSVCRATSQLHLKDGTVHKHGPRCKPCTGSHKPPLDVSSLPQGSRDHTPAAGAAPVAESASVSDAIHTTVQPNLSSPGECTVIKHIPKSARPACASHLAGVRRAIVARPADGDNWVSLFSWSSHILQTPKRGGKRHNLTNVVKKRISEFPSRDKSLPRAEGSSGLHSTSSSAMFPPAIRSKLEDGNLRAAIRLLSSDDTPALPSADNLARLQEKHPQASSLGASITDQSQSTPLSVEESDVRKAVLSFPADSSGGADGLRQ